jgi:hypothetical protein
LVGLVALVADLGYEQSADDQVGERVRNFAGGL